MLRIAFNTERFLRHANELLNMSFGGIFGVILFVDLQLFIATSR